MYWLYQIGVTLGAPLFAFLAVLRARRRPALARLTAPPRRTDRPVWIHACSVGEVNVARPLIEALRTSRPTLNLVLSVSTPTGHAHAEMTCSDVPLLWFPVDQRFVVRRFFRRVQPRALILVETELWPNVLTEAARRGVPVALVNGRLSDKHAGRYFRLRALFAPALRHLALAAMQSERYAARIRALGVPGDRVCVTGVAKFDAATADIPETARERLRHECGLDAETPIVVFGSTRPGDESLAHGCFARLRVKHPSLRLVIAPRHIARAEEVAALFADRVTLRRTQLRDGALHADWDILLVDTLGELTAFYAIATVAVVGEYNACSQVLALGSISRASCSVINATSTPFAFPLLANSRSPVSSSAVLVTTSLPQRLMGSPQSRQYSVRERLPSLVNRAL